MASDAALGAAQTGASEIAEAKFQQEHFGYSKTGSEIAMDMAYAAASSALIGAVLHGIGEGAGYMVGLHSAAEQAQALYPVLPRIGRDAATILENERQVAANGPASDLITHRDNVARASEALTNGKRPIPIDSPERNYLESETTPDGFQLKTTLEVVEFDELRPGSRLNQQVKQDVDSGIAKLKAMSDEELIRFRIEGTLTPDGKAKIGGKTVESFPGLGVHEGFKRFIWKKPGRYVGRELMKWRVPKRLEGKSGAGQKPDGKHSYYELVAELKPKSLSGRQAGRKQIERYEAELGVRAFSLEWGITQAQYDEIIGIKWRIMHLQRKAGLWADPKRPRRRGPAKEIN